MPTSPNATDTAPPRSALNDPTPWVVRYQRALDEMTDGENRVGSYFMDHPEAVQSSISELVDSSGLGYGTIIRFCQKLGCRGFQEFKVLMARDSVTQKSANEHGEEPDPLNAVLERLNEDMARTGRNIDRKEIEKAAVALCEAKRVLCVGVASSAPLALSLDWKIKRFGIVSSFISDGYVMAVEASLLRKDSVLVAVSSSGATKDIVTAARLAHDAGATVIALTNFTKAPLVDSAGIRLITSTARDPLAAEVPSTVAGELVLELLVDQIRRLHPEVDRTVLETFSAIASRKL